MADLERSRAMMGNDNAKKAGVSTAFKRLVKAGGKLAKASGKLGKEYAKVGANKVVNKGRQVKAEVGKAASKLGAKVGGALAAGKAAVQKKVGEAKAGYSLGRYGAAKVETDAGSRISKTMKLGIAVGDAVGAKKGYKDVARSVQKTKTDVAIGNAKITAKEIGSSLKNKASRAKTKLGNIAKRAADKSFGSRKMPD